MQFLSAQWQHLLFANYRVPREVLEPLVPSGTKLDTFEGGIYASLLAFLFKDLRVLGIPVPFHGLFEEVNLRFYVTPEYDPSIRAVTFIKENVPHAAIPWVANNLFGENYETVPMSNRVFDNVTNYRWGRNLECKFAATHRAATKLPDPGSFCEFITEHYWGYTDRNGSTLQYQVAHPQWEVCMVDDYDIELDFATEYGNQFDFLNNQTPHSVLYCRGSHVTVSPPSSLPKRAKSTVGY